MIKQKTAKQIAKTKKINNQTELNKKVFLQLLTNCGLPMPVTEFQFNSKRKWRFDYAYPAKRIAIEIEGGIFQYGRHTRPIGFVKDMEKYNHAAIFGWRLLRFQPNEITSLPTIDFIKDAYYGDSIKDYSIQDGLFKEN